MVTNRKLTIFVASHDSVALTGVPRENFITSVNLDEIAVSNEIGGQLMAESRIYFHPGFRNSQSEYTGLCSPRWNERFPSWPSIENMIKPVMNLRDSQILAPQALATKISNIPNWIKAQDLVHPGISKHLFHVWDEIGNPKVQRGWLPMGNTYILPRNIFKEVIGKWDILFPLISKNNFKDLDFLHKCIKCGLQSEFGIGRWKSNRQASYLLERVIALIIASIDDIHVVNINKEGAQINKSPLSTTYGLPWTAKIYGITNQAFRNKKRCNHLHFGPGKK